MKPIPVKVVIVGDPGTGKTSLLSTFVLKKFPKSLHSSLLKRQEITLTLDGKVYDLTLVDTEGYGTKESAHRRSLKYYYPSPDLFIITYSMADVVSYEHVFVRWIPEIKRHSSDCKIMIVGTKADRKIEEGKNMTELSKNLREFDSYVTHECSAKLGEGIETLFIKAIRLAAKDKNQHRT